MTVRDLSRAYLVRLVKDGQKIRVKPARDQGLVEGYFVRFPRNIRKMFPIGTEFETTLEESNGHYRAAGEILLLDEGAKKVRRFDAKGKELEPISLTGD